MKAIVSVSDKTGLVELARGLVELDVELFATGGTLDALIRAGLSARAISELTGFPEILDGRVKTLHPAVHAGILARRDLPDHLAQLEMHGIQPIDLVVVNLYPFAQTIERPGATDAEAIENIDVGGPALLRAAAKNHAHVLPVVDPADYPAVLAGLRAGGLDLPDRRRFAAKAFQHTASYDTAVAGYLRDESEELPPKLTIALEKRSDLRYGENPHQRGALYAQVPNLRRERTLVGATQICGKQPSFTDTLDVDVALGCARDFAAPTVAIVKHGVPFGLACGESLVDTYSRALHGDPQSAVGGCVAFNRPLDEATARLVAGTYFEDVVAPGFSDAAQEILTQRSPDVRLYKVDLSPLDASALRVSPTLPLDLKRISGGFLVQTPDVLGEDEVGYRSAGGREPTLEELVNMLFAWRVVKHVRSTAVVLARQLHVVGVGAGQPSRDDAARIAVRKASDRAAGSVMASDAWFRNPVAVALAADVGISAVIQPEGYEHNDDILRVADRHHIAVILTDRRHFRH